MKREDFLKKLEVGEVFLKNSYEGAGIRILKNVAWVKFPGEEEFLAKAGSEVVTDAILEQKEITHAEYNNL